MPRGSTASWSGHPQIAAKIHQQGLRGDGHQPMQCQIDSIFLGQTAEIDFHARQEPQMGPLPRNLPPSDQRHQRGDSIWVGQSIRSVKMPSATEYPRSDIKETIARLM